MADPWTEDLAALGDRSRHQLRSIAATRASVLLTGERKMRLFKSHPVFATALVIAVVAALGGGAYAFVDRVLLSVDPDKSAPDIERDVQQQLDNAHLPATAHADKADNKVSVSIETSDPTVNDKLDVAVPDGGEQLRIEVLRALTPAEDQQLAGFEADLDKSDDALTVDSVTKVLASHGFTTGVTVTATNNGITVSFRP